jgi:hypothetical protein
MTFDLEPYLASFRQQLTIDNVKPIQFMTKEQQWAFQYMLDHKLIASTDVDKQYVITPKGMNWDCQSNRIDHSKYGWKEER